VILTAKIGRESDSGSIPNLLKLRSDQTDSVSVDLHQQRLNGDGRLLSRSRMADCLRSSGAEKIAGL
jgi:hypothetical protein